MFCSFSAIARRSSDIYLSTSSSHLPLPSLICQNRTKIFSVFLNRNYIFMVRRKKKNHDRDNNQNEDWGYGERFAPAARGSAAEAVSPASTRDEFKSARESSGRLSEGPEDSLADLTDGRPEDSQRPTAHAVNGDTVPPTSPPANDSPGGTSEGPRRQRHMTIPERRRSAALSRTSAAETTSSPDHDLPSHSVVRTPFLPEQDSENPLPRNGNGEDPHQHTLAGRMSLVSEASTMSRGVAQMDDTDDNSSRETGSPAKRQKTRSQPSGSEPSEDQGVRRSRVTYQLHGVVPEDEPMPDAEGAAPGRRAGEPSDHAEARAGPPRDSSLGSSLGHTGPG